MGIDKLISDLCTLARAGFVVELLAMTGEQYFAVSSGSMRFCVRFNNEGAIEPCVKLRAAMILVKEGDGDATGRD